MKEPVSTYKARDGEPLSYRSWRGAGDVIIYLHGVESHSGWFAGFAAALNMSGFAVYGVDRRGSGLNSKGRGDCQDYMLFLNDISDFINFAGNENPGRKIYLAGICWGGFLAANFAACGKAGIDGLILLSPAIYRKVDLPLYKKAAVLAASYVMPKMKFNLPINDDMFTSAKRHLDFIRSDALRLRRLTARFFREITRMEERFGDMNHRLGLPLLVLLAGTDEIVDNARVKAWFAAVESADKEIALFGDKRHVLPFDDEDGRVSKAVIGWCAERKRPVEYANIKD